MNYLDLIRLNRPQGFCLLFFPCVFGFNAVSSFDLKISLLFLICSILMRGVGCIINDIVDKDLDKFVERTKNRPITCGKISPRSGIIFAVILALISLVIALSFLPMQSIAISVWSLALVGIYPFCKRFTYFPQVILGFTFNIGALVGWSAVENISFEAFLLYIGLVFWTIGYDTIYALSDLDDDRKVGIKSTALFFGKNTPIAVIICYACFTISLILLGIIRSFGLFYFVSIFLGMIHMLRQVLKIKDNIYSLSFSIFEQEGKGREAEYTQKIHGLLRQDSVTNLNFANGRLYQNIFRSNILTGILVWIGFILKI